MSCSCSRSSSFSRPFVCTSIGARAAGNKHGVPAFRPKLLSRQLTLRTTTCSQRIVRKHPIFGDQRSAARIFPLDPGQRGFFTPLGTRKMAGSLGVSRTGHGRCGAPPRKACPRLAQRIRRTWFAAVLSTIASEMGRSKEPSRRLGAAPLQRNGNLGSRYRARGCVEAALSREIDTLSARTNPRIWRV